MKVLLVNPPVSLEERYGPQMRKFGAVSEPMGILYIASFLEKKGFEVKILDAAALGMGLKEFKQFLKKNYFDVVGLTMLTTTFSAAKKTIKAVKAVFPSILTIVGGPHPTVLPIKTLEEIKELDVACIGEGEWTMYELVSALEKGKDFSKIRGIAYREGKRIIRNSDRPFEANLDVFPMPARHLLDIEKYSLTASRTSGSRYCPTLIIARGCPFRCAFCSKTFGRTFRHHSVGRIIEELELLINKYGASQVNLEADTISVDNKFLSELCEAIVEKKLNQKIKWTCESRVNTVTEDLLIKMKKAGCWQISYGVESGTQRLLDLIKKDITLRQIEKTFEFTKKQGISIRGFFMLGLPTETREESLRTIEFAKKLDPDWAQFTLTTPYPGTYLYDLARESKEIKSKNWDKYNTWGGWKEGRVVYVTKGRTEKELKRLQKQAVYEFYMRPKILLRFLKKSFKSPGEIKKLFQGFWVLLLSKIQ